MFQACSERNERLNKKCAQQKREAFETVQFSCLFVCHFWFLWSPEVVVFSTVVPSVRYPEKMRRIGVLSFILLCGLAVSVFLFFQTEMGSSKPSGPKFRLYPSWQYICDYASDSSPLIIFVKSALTDVAARQTVRRTWGVVARKLKIPFVFVVGNSSASDIVKEESLNHSDILMGDFSDFYRNLQVKTYSFFYWYTQIAQRKCFSKRPIFATDVDVILFPENLHRLTMKWSETQKKSTVFSLVWKRTVVTRDNSSKWFVEEKVYPFPFCPHYGSGKNYILFNFVCWQRFRKQKSSF